MTRAEFERRLDPLYRLLCGRVAARHLGECPTRAEFDALIATIPEMTPEQVMAWRQSLRPSYEREDDYPPTPTEETK